MISGVPNRNVAVWVSELVDEPLPRLDWRRLHGGTIGNEVWRVTDEDESVDIVVKHALNGELRESANWEGNCLQETVGMAGVVPLVGVNNQLGVVVTKFVHGVCGSKREWSENDYGEALRILHGMQRRLSGRPDDSFLSRWWPNDRIREWKELERRALPDVPPELLLEKRHELEYVTSSRLCSPGHYDAHPQNWMWTDTGPVLLDFGCVRNVPPHYDDALLLSMLDVDTVERLLWADRNDVPRDLLLMVACRLIVPMVGCMDMNDARGRAWCARYWNPIASIVEELAA